MKDLTSSQKSIWVTEQYYKGSSVNNISGFAMIEEQIDFEKLEQAIQIVVQKHDNFWLQLKIEDGEVKQVLSERKKIKIDTMVFASKNELKEAAKRIARTPFNIEKSELFKFYIFKLKNGQGGFMPSIHHLISDAWTIALISNEVIKAYSDLKHNQEVETKAIYSYLDYIKSEQEYIQSEKYQKDKAYWEEKFTQIPEVATIPGSKENVDESNPLGNRKKFEIQGSKVEKIKQYCKENKISLYNFFMAIYGIYIGEISNLDEFVIGTPILNRTNFKEKSAMGMFVNMAPFKINMSQDIDFKAFVKNIASDSMGMLKHQKYSYQHLLENLRSKNKSLPNLYNIFLSYQITNAHQSGEDMNYTIEWVYNGCCAEHIDIQIFDINDTGDLSISYDYKTSIYEESDIENLHQRILNVINQVIEKENIDLKDIEIVTPEERKKLVEDFNKTELQYDENETVISLFEKQAEKTPNKTAIICNNQKLTYKELNEKANMLARDMIEKGVKQKDIIGIMLNRSPEMIVGLVAILKCGATYLPIDPEYPAERISYMIENSETKLVLVNDNTEKFVSADCSKINIKNIENQNKENLNQKIDGNSLVYLIYTSGSTGKPKGVQITNRNLNNFIKGMKQEIDFNPDKTMVSVTTICFDIFGLEMWCSLTSGLTLVVANELEQNMPALLSKLCLENNVNMIQTTPSRYSVLFEDTQNLKFFENITEILVGGEAVNDKILANMKKYSKAKIFNVYGPTETTIWSTLKELTNEEKITVGKPIANTQCYILNKNHKLLPINMPGELYIGGDGVSKGYLKRDDLNEEKFIKSPFIRNSKIYNTNDLAYFTEEGEIVHLGRTDFQVKIRGFRIELGEIENVIEKNKNVNQAVVVKRKLKNGHDALIAYYTIMEDTDVLNELKQSLNKELPQYMVPQYFVEIEKMPHTPNGKIDRKALPEPDAQQENKNIIEARNELDQELINIIAKMLRIEQISLEDKLLELGGDSLTAITLSTKILSKYNVQINIKDIISGYTIKDISDYIKENQEKNTVKIKIEKAPKQETYPLSSAQKRIYYNSKMIGDENLVYNMPGGIMVDGILDRQKVKNAFEQIIQRHSALRTSFILQESNVAQKINENVEFDVAEFHNTENEIEEILKHFSKPFKLDKDLLIRVELHYIDNKKTLLLVEAHHAIMDGTALNNLIIEFERLYNGEDLKIIPIQYKDYAVWENNFIESDAMAKYEEYWVNKFKEAELSQLNLPYDYKVSATRSYKGNKISNIIDEQQFRKIEKYAKQIGVSPYMLFISALFILLYKYTGQEEITLGSPIANRDIDECQEIIGMFVNNIVIKANIKSEETFQEFLNVMKEQILDGISNQQYPFDMLVKKLGIKGDNSKNPLFDVMFTYQNKEENILHLDEHEARVIEIDNEISKFNLSLEIKPKSHIINIEYCTDLFKKQTIERFFEHYMNVIDAIIDNNNVKISDISIISEQEKNKILYEFNDTKTEYPRNKTVAQLFEEQVEKTPYKIAVVFEDTKLTYKELNEKANQLAKNIRKQNICSEDVIAILLDKSLEMIVAILAILKNGCTYLPIDIGYPKERKEYILKDSNAKLLLTSRDLNLETDLLVKSLYIDLDTENIYSIEEKQNLDYQGKSSDLAYIMYTSGSTGKPKGVMIENRSIVRLVKNTNYIEFKEDDKILQTGSIVFDACTLEIWGALLNGLELYIIKKEELLDASLLHTYILKNKISVLWLTAPLFNQLCEENPHMFRTVRCVLSGGDVLSCKHINMVKVANPDLKIINGYGPTENTTFSCCHHIEKQYKQSIPIGKPIANSTGYIVSKDGNLQPVGIPGELWVGGDGVARGYVNNIDLTTEKFIDNPFGEGKIYKTGDLTRWNNDGTVEFLGRIDSQIKIRGFRVELSEITTIVSHFEGIKEAYTVFKEVQKEKAICTYIVAKTEIDIQNLKDYLSKFLPKYMVPKYIVQVKKLPKNQNGKIDKNALPEIKIQSERNKEIILPTKELEKKIYDIFKSTLKVEELSIDDNFFECGGDSISAMRLQVEALKNNLDITYGDIFKYSTVKELAIRAENSTKNLKIEKAPKATYYPISSAQKRMYLTSSMYKESTLYNVTGGILLEDMPEINKLQEAINNVINRQEALRTYFEILNDGEIIQRIDEHIKININIVETNKDNIDEIIKTYQKPFDLSKAPLMRIYLVKLPNHKFLFMLDAHHIILDGTSLNIFLKEVADLYSRKPLENLYIDYKDFAVWESEKLKNNEFENTKKFWVDQYDKDIPILNMPTTYSRPAIKSYEGKTFSIELSKGLTEKIVDFTRKNDITMYMFLLASYYILLYKYTGQEEIIVGSPISGRTYKELENIIGMFVNTLPLRNKIDSEKSINKFLGDIKENLVNAYSHQEYPFDSLINELNIPRDNSRNPLFDTMFIYQNEYLLDVEFDGKKAKYYIPKSNTSKFDLTLETFIHNGKLKLCFEYWTQLFDEEFIKNLSNHYMNILERIIDDSSQKISEICILGEAEKDKILYEFNNTKMEYIKEKTIANLFEEQVQKTPNNIAIVFEGNGLTYKELNEKANQLARYLINQGIKGNSIVGIIMPRSLETLVGMIAVLKTGACYIPIDPELPNDRIGYMITNSKVSALLVKNNTIADFKIPNIDISFASREVYNGDNTNPNIKVNPESPSYMIYTSGSTGKPKGVVLKHKALSNLANYLNKKVEFLKDEYSNMAIASITTISFDIFIFETLICLQRGLKIIMANESEQNTPNLLDELISRNNVKAIQMTPSRMYIFVNNKNSMPHLKNLKYVVLAGEALPKDLLNNILELGNITVYNGYGPSETTVFSTFTDVTKYDEVTIGVPLANTRIYILDKDKNICPIGHPGEIYIAGDGVGIGYSNNSEITKERFIDDIFYPNEKMYKTGDLGKYLPNGEIHYIGRTDNQIKIRGLRIELDEIEKCILGYPNIEKCIITADVDNNGRQYIVAYLSVSDRVSTNKLRLYLRKLLPKYMVPSYFVILDSIPYLNNGKINKKALPKVNINALKVNTKTYIAPRNNMELQIVNIFQNILSISPIGIDDNFFELGGDSLLAINLQVELMKLNFNITYPDIFDNPTAREMAVRISTAERNEFNDIDKTEFTKFENILNKTYSITRNIKEKNIENIFLTGATGFLGAHILAEFLENEKGIAYCAIRTEAGLTLENKLLNKLHFYFGDKYDKYIGNRVIIVNSDLTQNNLGMTEDKINSVFEKISCVINSAAKVSHFGDYSNYKKINVNGTENLLKLCKKFNKRFYQISTLSVSGNSLVDQSYIEQEFTEDVVFRENNFFINQSLDNVYVRSKFEAEKLVLKYIADGLEGYICRVGNLMSRFSDGKFQPNVDENAYIGRLLSLSKIGCIPDYMLNAYMEFTPVDCCAKAIITLAKHPTEENRIFHLYNHNHVDIGEFVKILREYMSMDIIPNDMFIKKIDELLTQKDFSNILSGVLRDFDKDKKLVYESKVKLNSSFTIEYLRKIGFEWPYINETYLRKFLEYFYSIGYIHKEEK